MRPGEGVRVSYHHLLTIFRVPVRDVIGGLALILYKYSPGIFSNTTLIRLIIIHKERDMKITHSGYKTIDEFAFALPAAQYPHVEEHITIFFQQVELTLTGQRHHVRLALHMRQGDQPII